MNQLKNQVSAITGAAGGLGKAIAMALCQQGYHLALLDRQSEPLAQLKKELCALTRHTSQKIQTYLIDVSQEVSVTDVFSQIVEDFNQLDVLINNAGILKDHLLIKLKAGHVIDKLPLADWQKVMDVNLTGVFLCGREAASHMAQLQQGGVIINLTSLARRGNFGQSSYAASKAGVASLTVTWAKELSRWKIRVAGIAPGVIETAMTANMKPDVLNLLCQRIPNQRLGKPEEVAHAVNFILANDYFNARILELDGGLTF